MPKAIVVRELGGADRLRYEDVSEPLPGPGEARVRHTAIGLNFVDVYIRSGRYNAPGVPFVPGQEGVGRNLSSRTRQRGREFSVAIRLSELSPVSVG